MPLEREIARIHLFASRKTARVTVIRAQSDFWASRAIVCERKLLTKIWVKYRAHDAVRRAVPRPAKPQSPGTIVFLSSRPSAPPSSVRRVLSVWLSNHCRRLMKTDVLASAHAQPDDYRLFVLFPEEAEVTRNKHYATRVRGLNLRISLFGDLSFLDENEFVLHSSKEESFAS